MTERPGVLYVVATPIGNLEDISPRARQVLGAVALIAAEDTRHSGALLAHFGIATPLISLHDYNEADRTPQLLKRLQRGESLALISDAGTPLISDPGFELVRAAQVAGLRVSPVPGPSALVAALSTSGLPTDRFVFEGFLPPKAAARRERLAALAAETRTLVFYESVHRLADSLQDMRAAFGAERRAVLARELTKLHEAIVPAKLQGLCELAATNTDLAKGEAVVLVAGADATESSAVSLEPDALLKALLEELPLKQAAALAARITGGNRNRLYKRALELCGRK